MTPQREPGSDEQLLAETGANPEAFAEFYERHLPAVLRFLLARSRDREVAVDLAAEVFATALAERGKAGR